MMFVHLNRCLLKSGHNADLICPSIKTKLYEVQSRSKFTACIWHTYSLSMHFIPGTRFKYRALHAFLISIWFSIQQYISYWIL
jgi:hypothetical protein